ncbi:unnamed protein product [Ilex paraguariensis]|uniref:Uncharacterized protein n=1 Tax=Ilex paraguariensis TaxID=185542 RepID=A0ABC8UJI6_9AQUA
MKERDEAMRLVSEMRQKDQARMEKNEMLSKDNEILRTIIQNMVITEREQHSVLQQDNQSLYYFMATQIIEFMLTLIDRDIQILDLESSVEQEKKEKDTSEAENVQLKQTVARLESEKEEMVKKINELSVHVLNQQYQTTHVHKVLPYSAENKGKEKFVVKKRRRRS